MAKSKKPKTKKSGDKSQAARFADMAKELGADESGEAFERAFRRLIPPKKRKGS